MASVTFVNLSLVRGAGIRTVGNVLGWRHAIGNTVGNCHHVIGNAVGNSQDVIGNAVGNSQDVIENGRHGPGEAAPTGVGGGCPLGQGSGAEPRKKLRTCAPYA